MKPAAPILRLQSTTLSCPSRYATTPWPISHRDAERHGGEDRDREVAVEEGHLFGDGIRHGARCIPLTIYFATMFFASFFLAKRIGGNYPGSTTVAFAAVVGPLIEVPVLIGLVNVALRFRRGFAPELGAESSLTSGNPDPEDHQKHLARRESEP